MEIVIKISKCNLGWMIRSVDAKVYLFNIKCEKKTSIVYNTFT